MRYSATSICDGICCNFCTPVHIEAWKKYVKKWINLQNKLSTLESIWYLEGCVSIRKWFIWYLDINKIPKISGNEKGFSLYWQDLQMVPGISGIAIACHSFIYNSHLLKLQFRILEEVGWWWYLKWDSERLIFSCKSYHNSVIKIAQP